jgi:hypothetical protein
MTPGERCGRAMSLPATSAQRPPGAVWACAAWSHMRQGLIASVAIDRTVNWRLTLRPHDKAAWTLIVTGSTITLRWLPAGSGRIALTLLCWGAVITA